MNRLLVRLALALAACAPLAAQQGSLTLKSGQKFPFSIHSALDISLSFQGKEMAFNSTVDASSDIVARKVGKEKIDWVQSVTNAHVRAHSPTSDRTVDSVIKTRPLTFTTDRVGHVLRVLSKDEALTRIFGGTMSSNLLQGLFSPMLARAVQPGESWEEKSVDTVTPQAIVGEMIVRRTTKYTYDGTVDTLTMKVARVRSEVTSMTIEGTASLQGVSLTIQGDGSGSNVFYYSEADHLMLAAKSDLEMRMQMTMSQGLDLVIPLTQKVTITTVRRGL